MAMVLFLVTHYGSGEGELIFYFVFGVILVLAAILTLKIEKSVFKGKSISKVILGSLGLSFGLMLLVSILGLPFFGFRLLDTIMGHNTGVIWVVSALLVSPISAKYIK